MTLDNVILGVLGAVISVVTTYFPFVSDWYYNTLPEKLRGPLMVFICALVAAGLYGVSCAQWFDIVPCTEQGVKDLGIAFIKLLLANQIVYLVTPKSPAKLA